MTQLSDAPESGLAWSLPAKGETVIPVRRPVDVPNAGEALIKVEAVGLCGSDRFLRSGGFGDDVFPIIPGHEAAGTVIAVGQGDDEHQWLGQRVAVYYIDPDTDFAARSGKENLGPGVRRMGVDVDGALSQFITRPLHSLVHGQGLPAIELAVLSDAVATPYHALRLAEVTSGQVVAVIGTGGIGSNAVQLATLRGARVIAVGRSREKLEVARSLGAEKIIASVEGADAIRAAAGGHIDVVIQCVGSGEMDELAIEIAGIGSTVVLVGASATPFSTTSMSLIQKELRVLGSRGFTRQDIADVIAMRIEHGLRLEHLLTDVRPFADAAGAFETIGDNGRLRTIIEPWVGYGSIQPRESGEAT
ncbi:MAG: zinc-binding dehydrogenase [Microcella sp.]|uniref:alcohol dehydrogenase catalytic domain-containing protein n=1 Tax=Microcella sp. TaxID=1913979 RepID=UPI00331593A1